MRLIPIPLRTQPLLSIYPASNLPCLWANDVLRICCMYVLGPSLERYMADSPVKHAHVTQNSSAPVLFSTPLYTTSPIIVIIPILPYEPRSIRAALRPCSACIVVVAYSLAFCVVWPAGWGDGVGGWVCIWI